LNRERDLSHALLGDSDFVQTTGVVWVKTLTRVR
jgi:hypothetical protein